MASKEINSITGIIDSANLKAYYRFESGALTTDSSGEGHTLTAISDPAEDASGKFGGAVVLDGNDAYSAVNHADFNPTGVFSVGAWIKTSTTGVMQLFFLSGANGYGWMFAIQNTNKLFFQSAKQPGATLGTHYQFINGTTNVCDGNWHFVVGVYDGSYLRVYVDGASDATPEAWSNGTGYTSPMHIRVGCYSIDGANSFFLTGSIDDVFLLNGTALSAEEVKGIYIGWKKFNGCSNVSVKTINGLTIASVKSFNGI